MFSPDVEVLEHAHERVGSEREELRDALERPLRAGRRGGGSREVEVEK